VILGFPDNLDNLSTEEQERVLDQTAEAMQAALLTMLDRTAGTRSTAGKCSRDQVVDHR